MLGDCYLLAGISAFAQYKQDHRLRGGILTDSITDQGVFGLQSYVRSNPFDLVIDDYIPFWNDKYPTFV